MNWLCFRPKHWKLHKLFCHAVILHASGCIFPEIFFRPPTLLWLSFPLGSQYTRKHGRHSPQMHMIYKTAPPTTYFYFLHTNQGPCYTFQHFRYIYHHLLGTRSIHSNSAPTKRNKTRLQSTKKMVSNITINNTLKFPSTEGPKLQVPQFSA